MFSLKRTFLTGFLLLCGLGAALGQEVRLRAAVAAGDGFVAVGEVMAFLDAGGNVLDTLSLEVPLVSLAAHDGWLYAIDTVGKEIQLIHPTGVAVARIEPPLKGRLRAVAADEDVLWAVTDAGEIIRSEDGFMWKTIDFNGQYSGFYPTMDFRAVAAGGGSVMVAGLTEDGRPAAFISVGSGAVWSERLLDYTLQGRPRNLNMEPFALSYDAVQDSFYMLGSDGASFRMPSCSHCNSLDYYPVGTLYARVPLGFDVLLLGSDGFIKVEKP